MNILFSLEAILFFICLLIFLGYVFVFNPLKRLYMHKVKKLNLYISDPYHHKYELGWYKTLEEAKEGFRTKSDFAKKVYPKST